MAATRAGETLPAVAGERGRRRGPRRALWALGAVLLLAGCGGGGVNTGGSTQAPAPPPPSPPAPAPAPPAPAPPPPAATVAPQPPPAPPEDAEVPVAVAVQDDRLTGPAVPADQIPGRLDLVRATGARVTRVDVLWSDVAPTRPADEADPADPAYRWERADAILRGYAERGIAAIVSSYSTPAWAADGPEVPPLGPISPRLPDAAAYGRFAGALARRYSGSTRDAQGRVLPRVRHFEIWNEPNIGVFLSPQSDPSGARPARDRYVEVVGQAGPQIRAANPGAVIIAGVAGPRGRTGEDGTGTLDWIDAVAGARGGAGGQPAGHVPAAARPGAHPRDRVVQPAGQPGLALGPPARGRRREAEHGRVPRGGRRLRRAGDPRPRPVGRVQGVRGVRREQ